MPVKLIIICQAEIISLPWKKERKKELKLPVCVPGLDCCFRFYLLFIIPSWQDGWLTGTEEEKWKRNENKRTREEEKAPSMPFAETENRPTFELSKHAKPQHKLCHWAFRSRRRSNQMESIRPCQTDLLSCGCGCCCFWYTIPFLSNATKSPPSADQTRREPTVNGSINPVFMFSRSNAIFQDFLLQHQERES